MRELEVSIDDLYAGVLDDFVRERDALAKARAPAGDLEGAARVRALRKPVVSAWALNRLARQDPEAVSDLVALGDRLRSAQRRAISGADVEPLREAIEERRWAVSSLTRTASDILEAAGIGAAPHTADLTSTLEAAAADEEAAELLRSGRVVKPLRPPSAFGEHGLRVLEGGRRAEHETASSTAGEESGKRDIGHERRNRRANWSANSQRRSDGSAPPPRTFSEPRVDFRSWRANGPTLATRSRLPRPSNGAPRSNPDGWPPHSRSSNHAPDRIGMQPSVREGVCD